MLILSFCGERVNLVPGRATGVPPVLGHGQDGHGTSGGPGVPPAARLHQPSLLRIVEAAEGIKPEPSWVHAPLSFFDLRFELTSFIFIYIMAIIK
jgi:hypothetical protein